MAGFIHSAQPPAPSGLVSDFQISLETDNTNDVSWIVVASPIDSEAHRRLSRLANRAVMELRLVNAGRPVPLTVAGTTVTESGRVVFRPAYPLVSGQKYEAKLLVPSGSGDAGAQLRHFVRVPELGSDSVPVIERIYPSAAELPANHLKFYLAFSEPMARGNIFQYFRLTRTDGTRVPEPFRETELWSADGRRLTLWFHPGRQKTGVNLNVEIGPILRPGESYRLVVDGRWMSARGVPLGMSVKKGFRAIEPDRVSPDWRCWRLVPPPAGGFEPLRVTFDETLDWGVVMTELAVVDSAKRVVAGQVTTGNGETEWQFVPAQEWRAGRYQLRAGEAIEDLAGNSLKRPFERDLGKSKPPTHAAHFREFVIVP